METVVSNLAKKLSRSNIIRWADRVKVDLGYSSDSEPMNGSDPPDPTAKVDLGSDENNVLSLADDLAFSGPENGSEKDFQSGMFLTPKY